MILPPAADQGIFERDAIPAGSARLRCLPARYPAAVCVTCVERAVDEYGRPLRFYNRSMSGGFQAVYADSGEEHAGHECWIDGVRCWAGEAHLGGTVVYPL